MPGVRTSLLAVACATAAVAAGQSPPQPSAQSPTFRVGVDGVMIDAVVTDRKGAVVRDLTADDFEVYQDGKRQKVTFTQFVPVITAAAPAAAGAAASAPVAAGTMAAPVPAPPSPAPPIARERVARTIVILVDDLGLSVEGLHSVKQGLRKFVETSLLPTDLVAVVRTGASEGVFRPFTNDREVLLSAVNGLRYNTRSRKIVAPSFDVVPGLHGSDIDEGSLLTASLATSGSLAALNLVVEAARDVPGRKTVIFASEGFDPADEQVLPGLDRAVDQATRSGVVVYAVDGSSLQTGALRASDDISESAQFDPRATSPVESGHGLSGTTRRLANARMGTLRSFQDTLTYLAEPTGGFAVTNTNDLGGGLLRISDDVRDYYVIGYEPDARTFAADARAPKTHQITVKVTRAGVNVRTRKEFLGVSDPEPSDAPPTPAQLLGRAAMSPFNSTAIAVRAAHQAGFAPGRGLFVRTIMHLDAQALSFSADSNGDRTAATDLVGLVYNSDGVQVAALTTGFDVSFDETAADRAIKDGVVFTARVWLTKPGGYQVRYAVRDRRTGAIGTTGGFVDVADVAGGAFALSGLVLRTAEGAASESRDGGEVALRPSDALRIFAPGTKLTYEYDIYNAAAAVQAVTSLWRGAERILVLPPVTLTRPGAGDPFVATGDVTLAGDFPAGAYVLQVAATSADPKQPKKTRGAVQRVAFDVK